MDRGGNFESGAALTAVNSLTRRFLDYSSPEILRDPRSANRRTQDLRPDTHGMEIAML
jgi:hypothetical protein